MSTTTDRSPAAGRSLPGGFAAGRVMPLLLGWLVSTPLLVVLATAGALASERPLPPIQVVPDLPEGYELFDRIVAFVNEQIVTMHDVDRAAAVNKALATQGKEGAEAPVLDEGRLRQESMEALIDEILVLEAAKALQLTVSDREVDNYIAGATRAAGYDQAQLEESVGRLGYTLAEYREISRKELLKARVVSIKVGSRVNVGDGEVQQVLDAEYHGGTLIDRAHAFRILLRVSPTATAEESDEVRRVAEQLQRLAEAAPERFGDLARKYSEDDSTRLSKGELGWVSRGTMRDEALERALFKLDVGQVGPVVRSQDGFEVLMVSERDQKPVGDLEEVRDQVYDRLVRAQKIKVYLQWVKELRDQAWVDVRL